MPRLIPDPCLPRTPSLCPPGHPSHQHKNAENGYSARQHSELDPDVLQTHTIESAALNIDDRAELDCEKALASWARATLRKKHGAIAVTILCPAEWFIRPRLVD